MKKKKKKKKKNKMKGEKEWNLKMTHNKTLLSSSSSSDMVTKLDFSSNSDSPDKEIIDIAELNDEERRYLEEDRASGRDRERHDSLARYRRLLEKFNMFYQFSTETQMVDFERYIDLLLDVIAKSELSDA